MKYATILCALLFVACEKDEDVYLTSQQQSEDSAEIVINTIIDAPTDEWGK